MTRIGVYILTTGAPVRIETIHARRRPPRSEITVGQDYTQRLPATKDYDLFVSNAGPVGQAFGSFGEDCYRLQVEAAFDDGNSWELACFLAHALTQHGRFAAAGTAVDEIVLASGRVDLAFDVGAVEHLKLKLDAARKTIEEWHGKGVPVTVMLPAPEEHASPLEAPEGAEISFCGSVAEVMAHVDLPWKAPKVSRALPLVRRRVLASRRILYPSFLAVLSIVALGSILMLRDELGSSEEGETERFDLADAGLEAHARELLKGLDADAGERKLRLALLPFRGSMVPINRDFADTITDALLRELLRQGRHEIVARDTIEKIITDMREDDGPDSGDHKSFVPELLKRAQGVDVLIKGRMRLEVQELELSFQAIDREGRLVAATRRQRMTLSPCQVSAACATLTMDQAIDISTRHFAERAPKLRNIDLAGIRYQDSGAQPPFARYTQQRLIDDLRQIYSKAGISLNFREPGTRTPPAPEIMADGATMLLEGTYWIFADAIELRLTLSDTLGGIVVWRGRVRRDSVDEMALLPSRDVADQRENDGFGPIEFQLSSDRGGDPAYRIGDKLDLTMRTDRDAWIYCYYSQVDGKILPILPNPEFWKQASGPRFAGGVVHHVPGQSTYPFDLVLSEPTGIELIKCFAVSRDVTPELPEALRGRTWAPIEPNLAAQIPQIFRNLPKAAISEASLVVTVIPSSSN
ncbi:MAG: DUF4384 domain-containing protein [Proteobacteria bacterium]|nr:DUF4384 domain-containing protein [Pseudomonadota bacterium]